MSTYARVDMIDAKGDWFDKLMENAESLISGLIPEITVKNEVKSKDVFGHHVKDLQTDVVVEGHKITGTLKYCDKGTLATDWGAGYFLVLKFTNIPEIATSVKVGLDPSQGSGLVELLGDPDMNGVFKITNQNVQQFRVEVTDGTRKTVQKYDLSGLVFAPID